jgi:hypothetical protein
MPDIIGDPAFVCLGLASAEDGLIVISLRLRFLSCCDVTNHVNGFLKKMCIRDGTLDFIDIHKEFSKQGSAIKPLFDTNDVSGVHISSAFRMPDIICDPAFVCLGLASAEDGLIVISLRLRFLSCCGVTGNSLFQIVCYLYSI